MAGEAARLLGSLHSMPYERARALVATLSDADFDAGVRYTDQKLAFAVSDHVLELGRVGPAVTLAVAAVHKWTMAEPENVIRALVRMARPEVDRALFFTYSVFRDSLSIRRAILADRRGPDGLPIIDPSIAERVIAELRGRRGAADGANDTSANAIEPAIARAALECGLRENRPPMVLYALKTLCEFGLREEVWPDVRAAAEKLAADYKSNLRYRQAWGSVVRMGEGEAFRRRDLPSLARRCDGYERLLADEGGVRFERLTPQWDAVLARADSVQSTSRDDEAPHGDPGLDAVAGRDDMPDEVRAAFEERYARAVWLRPRPDLDNLRLAVARAEDGVLPESERHGALGELVRRGLVSNALQAADVVATVPAADVLAWVVPGDTARHNCFVLRGDAVPEPAFRWVADQIRSAVISAVEPLGADPALWAALWRQVGARRRILATMVASVVDQSSDPVEPGFPSQTPEDPGRGVDPVAALISVAPPTVVTGLVAAVPDDPAAAEFVTWVLERSPLSSALAALAVGPHGTSGMRQSLARNAGAGEARLWELVAFEPVDPVALAEVFKNPAATEDLQAAAVIRAWAAGGRVAAPGAQALVPALESGDPVAVYAALHAELTTADAGHRALAYAALARAGAMESVWTLELERAGTIEKACASVRASMESVDAGPLLAAVDDAAVASAARRRVRGG